MNSPTIRPGTRWCDRQYQITHTVTEISADGVVTWSDPLPDPMDPADLSMHAGGFSWFGPVQDFLKQFVPINSKP